MPILIIVLLSIFAPSLSTPSPSDSLISRISVHRSDQYWVLEFICVEEKMSCLSEFVELPSGWVQKGDRIEVPLMNMRRVEEHKIIVDVDDGTGSKRKEEIKL